MGTAKKLSNPEKRCRIFIEDMQHDNKSYFCKYKIYPCFSQIYNKEKLTKYKCFQVNCAI
jgi:hypothetical protein